MLRKYAGSRTSMRKSEKVSESVPKVVLIASCTKLFDSSFLVQILGLVGCIEKKKSVEECVIRKVWNVEWI